MAQKSRHHDARIKRLRWNSQNFAQEVLKLQGTLDTRCGGLYAHKTTISDDQIPK